VGSNETRRVDLRIIAATHRNLEEMCRSGRFRDDLYYRLKVIEIPLPPLRERAEDIPELVSHFVALYAEANKKEISHVSPEAMEKILAYPWPGNVRELENAIERAVAMSNSAVLFPEDFAGAVGAAPAPATLDPEEEKPASSLEAMEKDHILQVLRETHFNKSKASAVLGIDRATLYRKALRYGIELRAEAPR
jgi:two-component system response regulator HydG